MVENDTLIKLTNIDLYWILDFNTFLQIHKASPSKISKGNQSNFLMQLIIKQMLLQTSKRCIFKQN